MKTGVLLITTGSPAAPTAPAVKAYLARFLSDPRIVDLPRWQWLPILHGIILRVRPAKSAQRYAQIWGEEGSPLLVETARQTRALQGLLDSRGCDAKVAFCCAYSAPEIGDTLSYLLDECGCEALVAVPLNPQYASVTNGTFVQALMRELSGRVRIPRLTVVDSFCDEPGYLDALAASVVRSGWTWADDGRHALVFTFHSTLVKDIEAGDVYRDQAERTAAAVAARLGIPQGGWHVGYQSVFDKRPWLGPLTQEELLPRLAERGVTEVAVVAPGFVAECLETHFDVDTDQRATFERLVSCCCHARRDAVEKPEPQGSFTYVPCLNSDPAFIAALADVVERCL